MPKNPGIEPSITYDNIMTCQWDMMNCNILVTAILNMQIRPIYRPLIFRNFFGSITDPNGLIKKLLSHNFWPDKMPTLEE